MNEDNSRNNSLIVQIPNNHSLPLEIQRKGETLQVMPSKRAFKRDSCSPLPRSYVEQMLESKKRKKKSKLGRLLKENNIRNVNELYHNVIRESIQIYLLL